MPSAYRQNTDSLAAWAASGLENRDDWETMGVRLLGYPPTSPAIFLCLLLPVVVVCVERGDVEKNPDT